MTNGRKSQPAPRVEAARTVLVVDDEAANRQLLSAILSAQGHRVLAAHDGPAALKVAASTAIDVILLDVMMPLMDGIEVCRRLRQELRLEHNIIVFVTALSDRDSRLRAREVGADDFLVKPIDGFELVFRVNQWLQLRRYRELEARNASLSCALNQTCEAVQDISSRVASAASALSSQKPGHALETARRELERAAERLTEVARDVSQLVDSSSALDASASIKAPKSSSASREHRS